MAAGEPVITSESVRDILKFKKSFLRRLRAEPASPREDWRRFVLVKVDARDGMSMYPRLLPGSTLLIDRHYNSLKPYRKNEQNMYAVRVGGGCTVKYVEVARQQPGAAAAQPGLPGGPCCRSRKGRDFPTTLSAGCATWESRRESSFQFRVASNRAHSVCEAE